MLPKEQRLNLKTHFRWTAAGKSLSSKNFKLFYRQGENAQPLVGVSIVSAQFKKAVLRNQAKRICLRLIEPHINQLPKNINLVIMPKAQVLEENFDDLSRELNDAVFSLKIN